MHLRVVDTMLVSSKDTSLSVGITMHWRSKDSAIAASFYAAIQTGAM